MKIALASDKRFAEVGYIIGSLDLGGSYEMPRVALLEPSVKSRKWDEDIQAAHGAGRAAGCLIYKLRLNAAKDIFTQRCWSSRPRDSW